jgi:hypothetical protein
MKSPCCPCLCRCRCRHSAVSNGMMVDEMMIYKGFGRVRPGPNRGTNATFAWRKWGKPRKPSVGIASVQAEIRTENLHTGPLSSLLNVMDSLEFRHFLYFVVCFSNTHERNVAVERLALLLRLRKIRGSNLGTETWYPKRFFVLIFPQFLR